MRRIVDATLRFIAAWIIGFIVWLWRCTCRSQPENDQRPAIRAAGERFVWAMLHAHAINGTIFNDEQCVFTMLSRSKDGDLLVPAFRLSHIRPMRGSTQSKHSASNKGGREALAHMVEHIHESTASLMIVDGPVGPRNTVHRGVVELARQTRSVIIPVVAIPSRRWIFRRTWDRLQLPKPFSTIRFIMADPITITRDTPPDQAIDTHAICAQIAATLHQLEAEYDPHEAAECARRKHRHNAS